MSAEPAASIGAESTLYQASRIDNLANTHAALSALANCAPTDHIALFSGHQHEEIGSRTRGGAAAPRLKNLLTRLGIDDWSEDAIILSCDKPTLCIQTIRKKQIRHCVHAWARVLYSSFLPATATPPPHAARPCSVAFVRLMIFRYKPFATVPICAVVPPSAPSPKTATGIEAIDLGAPMLAMHSIRELADLVDQGYMQQLMSAFLNA